MTLDDLTAKLNKDGFDVKRSTVYTRFQPKWSNSIQGKRHVNTVPIKLKTITMPSIQMDYFVLLLSKD